MIDDAINDDIARGETLEAAVASYKVAGEIPMVFGKMDTPFHAYDYLNSQLEKTR